MFRKIPQSYTADLPTEDVLSVTYTFNHATLETFEFIISKSFASFDYFILSSHSDLEFRKFVSIHNTTQCKWRFENEATAIPVTIYSTLELSDRVIVLCFTPLRDNQRWRCRLKSKFPRLSFLTKKGENKIKKRRKLVRLEPRLYSYTHPDVLLYLI